MSSLAELRTYWQVPSVAHFVYLFREGLKFPKIDYHELELAFLKPIPDADSDVKIDLEDHLLLKLIVTLLRGYFNEHRIDRQTWEAYLKKLCRIQWIDREGNESPFLSYTYDAKGRRIEHDDLKFSDLSLEAKSEIVYHLCEYRLFAEDSSDLVSHLVEDELRVEPIGEDIKGNKYWYFFGTRLYRENPEAVHRVQELRESVRKYKEREAIELAKKVHQEKQVTETQAAATSQSSSRKKFKSEVIPGERSSSRISKPVDRLNGQTLRDSVIQRKPISSNNSSCKEGSNNKWSGKNVKKNETPPDPNTSTGIPMDDLRAAWDLICDSESEWESLTASFSKSKHKCEQQLYTILNNNFLPRIREIAEEMRKQIEREQKAKIFELMPRRTSSRIEIKKLQQEEEEKKEAEERESRKRMAAQADERRKREEERMRQEEIKRQREDRARQRLAVLEDRAARAAIRRERKDDLMETGGITSNGHISTHKTFDPLQEDDENFNLSDPNVTMCISNGWPMSEHSYSSPKKQILIKAGGNHKNYLFYTK